MQAAQRSMRPQLPKRFYAEASAKPHEAGFAVFLDGRLARTPGRHPLAAPRRLLAEALAAEWAAQGERIDPATMPLTRLANAAIDRVAGEMAAVAADIVKYAASDLVCYRAAEPQSLADRQEEIWSPLLAWAKDALGARFALAAGIMPVAQDAATLAAIGRAVAPFDAFRLTALHATTTLTGSAVIALAVARGRLSAEEAWRAAHVDEDWQMSQWGADETAMASRALRWRDMQAAALILSA